MRRILMAIAFSAALLTPLAAQNSKNSKPIFEIVDRLFAAMKAKDTGAIKDVCITNASFIAIDPPRGESTSSTTRIFSVDAFAKLIADGTEEFIERMPNKHLKMSGNMAVVSGRYTFHTGKRFSHCGTNNFNLARTIEGWKIANVTYTLEQKCDADKKAVAIPRIEANSKDVSSIDGIINALYETISGGVGKKRMWGRDRTLYTPSIRFVSINSGNGKSSISRMDHEKYVNGSNEFMVKAGFSEREINRVVRRYGNLAQVFSTYEWETADKKNKGRGINSIGLYFDGKRWWISGLAWENEHKGNPIPKKFLGKR